MRTFKTEGIVIKRRNFREADRILTVLTKDYGKIQIKGNGVRRIPSRRSAHVELLNYSRLHIYRGNALPILTEAAIINDFSSIKINLEKIGLAYHLCELIDGLCPEDQEHRGVFELLRYTLEQLSDDGETGTVMHNFEIELLTILGYWNSTKQASMMLNTPAFIEDIIERKLRSKNIFSKLD